MSFYDFKFRTLAGEEIHFSEYKGNVCLVVNIASRCRFTPQLKELEDLYRLYKDQGFKVLAFPSNDFGKQEPLNNPEIASFCSEQFRVTFPVFEKTHVRGKESNPLFRHLSNQKLNGLFSFGPFWNFQKYLVDRNGKLRAFFLPFTHPTALRLHKRIEQLL